MTQRFVPGLDLCEAYFREVIKPLLDEHVPNLRYAAGRIGAGSDVLGFDTERSMDHDWGPRLTIWVDLTEVAAFRESLLDVFRKHLPPTFRGFPTGFARHESDGTFHMADEQVDGPLEPLIDISTAARWTDGSGVRPDDPAWEWIRLPMKRSMGMDPATWLTLPEQWLLEMTAGRIFHDDSGEITRVRDLLAWYPDDVWRYKLAAQWKRIDQLEPFIGRCGEVGDDLGSHLVAMTLVRDVMRMAFLINRRYAPYPKWFGTAFGSLPLSSALNPDLDVARFATTWQEREHGLVSAVATLARHHNTLGLTEFVDPEPRYFFNRPFRVMFASRFSEALMDSVADPAVRSLPVHLGGLDQFIDSTDAFNQVSMHLAIRDWMRAAGQPNR